MKILIDKKSLLLFFIFFLFSTCKSSPSTFNLNKCCKIHEYFNETEGKCSSMSNLKTFNESSEESFNWQLPVDLFFLENNLQLTVQNISEKNCFEIENFNIGRPTCPYNSEKLIQKLSSAHISPSSMNQFLFLESPSENQTQQYIVHKDDFCIDRTKDEDFIAELCIPKCNSNINSGSNGNGNPPCLRKCCPPHQILDVNKFACISIKSSESIFKNVSIFPSINANSKLLTKNVTEAETILDSNIEEIFIKNNEVMTQVTATHSGVPKCEIGSFEVDFRDKERYSRVSLLSSGHLEIETPPGIKRKVFWEDFCIDKIISSEDEGDASQGIDINRAITALKEVHQFALVCFPPSNEQDDDDDVFKMYRSTLYPMLTGISSMFLLITSIIYLILWKDLNLPGWLQFSYANCLLIAFTLLTIVQVWTEEIHKFSQWLCKFVGYTLHFSFLSCFFWLTSMNVDLWCSFRNTPIMTSFGGRNRRIRRYIGFAFFSISIPLLDTLCAAFLDYKRQQSNTINQNSVITTEIGENSCALNIHNKMAHLYFFYGEVGLLLVVNLLFFFCTVLCLRERQRETKFAHRQCTASDSSDIKRFRLFTRLFFIMGIFWIFELISWLTEFTELSKEIRFVFIVTDCLNALQGIAIFIMFVWKPHTWRQLRKKCMKVFKLESQASLMGPHTIKSSLKSSTSTKSTSVSSKTLSPTTTTPTY